MTTSVITEALNLVNVGRRADYVPPEADFTTIATIWSAILSAQMGVKLDIPPHTVGLLMIGLKVGREAGRHKHDNLVDIAGYVECMGQVIEAIKK